MRGFHQEAGPPDVVLVLVCYGFLVRIVISEPPNGTTLEVPGSLSLLILRALSSSIMVCLHRYVDTDMCVDMFLCVCVRACVRVRCSISAQPGRRTVVLNRPAPPKYPLRYPIYQLFEAIRASIEVHWGVKGELAV